MPPLRQLAQRCLATRTPAAVVEVIAASGSIPRGPGTRMLVTAAETHGTIGGGHLEWKAIEAARALLAAQRAGPDEAHYPLGPALGQCCGGAVTLRTEALTAVHLERWPASAPLFALQLYGAGHVGRAIARLLAELPCHVQWIDERDDAFPPDLALPPHIEQVCAESVEAEVRQAPPGAFYLVLTHSHDVDLRVAEAVLRRADFGFFGLIGSRTKRARFAHRFAQRGIDGALIERMTCPIGLPGIAGKEPAVIAVAAVAQLLQQAGAGAPGPAP